MRHGVHLSAVRGEIRMNKENILEIDNLERSYSTVMPDGETKVYSVLRGSSFQVKRGEFIGIMGSSGCGKTTLLKTIGMLNKPNGGRVLYNGEDTTEIYGDHLAEIRRTQLAFVFQDFYLMNSLTVRENIMMPLILNEDDPVESSKTAETMAEKLGIYNLDSNSSKQVIHTLSYINQEFGKTIVMVTHDPQMASYCSRLILLKDGVILEDLKNSGNQDAFYQEILGKMKEL